MRVRGRISVFVFICSTIFLSTNVLNVSSQQPVIVPSIGDTVPEMALNIHPSGKGTAITRSLSSYRGKWLVLDFWTKTCVLCIRSFPHLEELRKKFEGKVELVLIGKNDRKYNNGIEEIYERFRKEEKLRLDIAFDTVSFTRFGIRSTPRVVVIAPDGAVSHYLYGHELTEQFLEQLLTGRKDLQTKASDAIIKKSEYFPPKILTDSLHYTKLEQWQQKDGYRMPRQIPAVPMQQFEVKGAKLSSLYLLAYTGSSVWNSLDSLYGKLWPAPIFRTGGEALNANFSTDNNIFNYTVDFLGKKSDRKILMQTMRNDLLLLFGHRARIVSMYCDVLSLKVIDTDIVAKITSNGKEPNITGNHIGYKLQNVAMSQVVTLLHNYYQKKVFIDSTGIIERVDIEINAIMTNLEAIRHELVRQGIDLVNEKKEMDVLVIDR